MLIYIIHPDLYVVHEFQKMRSFAMVCHDFIQKKESRMANIASEWHKQTGNKSAEIKETRPAHLGNINISALHFSGPSSSDFFTDFHVYG